MLLHLCFISLAILLVSANGRYAGTFENNELTMVGERAEEKLGLCDAESICGYLQANAWGVNKKQFCSCPGRAKCPLVWDSMDGHSITQGSEQYKFCHKVEPLRRCEEEMVAYTSKTTWSSITDEKLATNDRLHCFCPETHKYQPFGPTRDYDLDATMAVMEFSFACTPLRECDLTEACKSITESPFNVLVNPRCVCPRGYSCPSISTRRYNTMPIGRGVQHGVKCQ